jgi:cytochrome P450
LLEQKGPTSGQHSPFPADVLADPYPFYRRLRTEDPVHWHEPWQAWVLTRYDDVIATWRDGRLAYGDRVARYLGQLPEAVRDELEPLSRLFSSTMAFMDPPRHTRLRGLVGKVFSGRVAESLRPRVQAIVDERLDQVQDAGQMDAIGDLAYPLPAIVIAEMLGVPAGDRDQFKRSADAIVSFLGTGRAVAENAERAQRSYLELADGLLRPLIAERRRAPRADLISALVAAEEQGDALDEEELIAMCVSFLTAGHETTTNLIGNGLLALLRNPDQLGRLRDDPGLIPTAVEELLRYDSPVQRQWRLATEELEVGGRRIAEGQLVYQIVGAANRDPAQFPEPERLDLGRAVNRHVAFGYGIHFCLGAPLARVEGQVTFETLLRRLPRLELASDRLEWQPNMAFRALRALPVAF